MKRKSSAQGSDVVSFFEVRDKRTGNGFLIVSNSKRKEIRSYKIESNQNKLLKIIKFGGNAPPCRVNK